MKISIAVPSYNYVQYIEACLGSIQKQNYDNFEVLIADGGSTDGSLDIIQQFCEKDNRFQLVSTQDDGQADAIQCAFSKATGDIFCFLNADDCYLSQSAFDDVVDAFASYSHIDLVSFGGYFIDGAGKWIKKINYRYHSLDGFHQMRYRTAVLQPGTFWKKAVYDSQSWPSEFHFVFDVVFFYRAFEKYSWLELSKPIAGYRLHGENKSLTIRPARIDELASFEVIKFSKRSFRVSYLHGVAGIMRGCEKMGSFGSLLKKCIYLMVNSLAYLTVYRLPGI